MRLYVASSWRNIYQPRVVTDLRGAGFEVYDFRNPAPGNTGFSWSAIDPAWPMWTTDEYVAALEHPIAREGFGLDFEGMRWADACVLVLPCGRSAHVEAGWMQGAGRPVVVYSPTSQEPELMYGLFGNRIAATFDEVVAHLHAIDGATGPMCEGEPARRPAGASTETPPGGETPPSGPAPAIERTHHPECWRDHPACAVARLEAVVEVRRELDELVRDLGSSEHGYAADLLGKAIEGRG